MAYWSWPQGTRGPGVIPRAPALEGQALPDRSRDEALITGCLTRDEVLITGPATKASPPVVSTSVGAWTTAAASPRPSSPVLAIREEGIKGRGMGVLGPPRPPQNSPESRGETELFPAPREPPDPGKVNLVRGQPPQGAATTRTRSPGNVGGAQGRGKTGVIFWP